MNKKLYKLTLDAQKSIGALSELAYETGVQDGLIKANALNALKPLGNTSMRWIPCCERMPEEKKEVLISADGELYIAEHEIDHGKGYWSEVIEYRNVTDVDAWMPLPEPYGGEQE